MGSLPADALVLPRRLRVFASGTGDHRVGDVLSSGQAWAGTLMLMLCGASGSGRSYPAGQYAEKAARTGLNRPGVSGGSDCWEGWSHAREHYEEVSHLS